MEFGHNSPVLFLSKKPGVPPEVHSLALTNSPACYDQLLAFSDVVVQSVDAPDDEPEQPADLTPAAVEPTNTPDAASGHHRAHRSARRCSRNPARASRDRLHRRYHRHARPRRIYRPHPCRPRRIRHRQVL